jgi:hypothetical protein
MFELFLRSLSESLQAFMPLAVAAACVRQLADRRLRFATRAGGLVAVPATIAAAFLFRQSLHQVEWDVLLTLTAIAASAWLLSVIAARQAGVTAPAASLGVCFGVALTVALFPVRETMKTGAVVLAAIDVRSIGAIEAVAGGAVLAALAATTCVFAGRRLGPASSMRAARAFAGIFIAQACLFAFHELTEARLLPASEPLHAATEPYGPDGVYGQYLSLLLIAVPLGVGAAGTVRRFVRVPQPIRRLFDRVASRARWAAATAVLSSRTARAALIVGFAGIIIVGAQARAARQRDHQPSAPPSAELTSMLASPHLLFRHTGAGAEYGALSVTRLEPAGAPRVIAGFSCDRVAFAGGAGICLQTDRTFFAGYKAIVFDRALKPTHSFKLEGSPSRTRISADGRVGAITVFVTGHSYAAGSFSTATTLVDMASGDPIGNLEQFSTWRDGVRVKAADVNFWGVSFTKDSNVFYATVSSAGIARVARGDLGLRKLTVLRDNVECPSLSPDNRSVAFKKRVGPGGAWRLHVMNLATMTDRAIETETRYVDDQVEWLDANRILYAVRRPASTVSDVWIAAVDGSTKPAVFLTDAESPVVVR